jgi:hypothetical protein
VWWFFHELANHIGEKKAQGCHAISWLVIVLLLLVATLFKLGYL